MVLLLFVVGLLVAAWPTSVARFAGGLRATSATKVRGAGALLVALALLTVLLLGPW